jgi:hypothetical protein
MEDHKTRRFAKWVRVDWVALVMVVIACYAGWLLIGNERDNRVEALAKASETTRVVACANADFASSFNKFIESSAERTRQRIGTPDELSTDRASLKSTERIIALFGGLAESVEPICGPVP